MGILDTFRKSREKALEGENKTPPPKGHTLAEVLNDKTNSHLLGTLLEKDGKEDLGRRVATRKLEKDDIELLEEYRIKYSEKVIESEKIENLLNEETVIEIARRNEDFAKIVNILGPKKAIRAIRSQLREICFTDGDRFSSIAEPIVEYDSYKNGEYKKTSDRVEKFCKDNNISVKGYLEALAIEDGEEKEKALKKLAREKQKGWKEVWNIISMKAARNLKGMKNAEDEMESSMAELDRYKESVGDMLFTSVSGNDDMRDAFARELLSENPPPAEPKPGFEGARKETPDALNEGDFNKAWETFKDEEAYGATINEYEQDALKEQFMEQQKEAYRKKMPENKGFWHSVFATMFEEKINSKKDTLK